MKNKKCAVYFLITFFVVGCHNARESNNSNNEAISITGNWSEFWPGLAYNNTYVIKQKGDQIKMSCRERSYYKFSHIHLTEKNLLFRITNTFDKHDLYLLDYNLFLNNKSDRLKGTVVTNHGVDAEVELVKL